MVTNDGAESGKLDADDANNGDTAALLILIFSSFTLSGFHQFITSITVIT